jgi:hypothetical protein
MKTTVTATIIVLAAFAIIGGVFSTSAPALAQTNATDNTTLACQWTQDEET